MRDTLRAHQRIGALLLGAALAAGCTGSMTAGIPEPTPGAPRDPSDPTNPGTPPDGTDPPATMPEYVLGFDLNSLNRFVEGGPATYDVGGRVISTYAVDSLRVADSATTVGADGSFHATVPVTPGVHVVPMIVSDVQGHTRNGHRALISTRYLPEDELNPGAAAMTVSNEVLENLVAPFRAEIESINLADAIRMRGSSFSQSGCTINLTNITHGRPGLQLVNGPTGELLAVFSVPNVRVTFTGNCSIPLVGSSSLSGAMTTNVLVSSALSAPPGETCIMGLNHSPPSVDLPGFDLDVSISGGGLLSLISPIIGEIMEGSVADTMKEQIAAEADDLFTEQSARLSLLSEATDTDFQGTNLHLRPCLTSLGPENGVLRARLGLAIQGPGGYPAPGAPQVDGDMPAAQANSLWLDANLISQMMFSIWRDGGLETEVSDQINFGLIALLAPDLRGRYPNDTPVTIKVQAHLPPVVRAAEPGMGDLLVEIGDLMIELKVRDELLFRVGILVKLTLELEPVEGGLMPTVTNTDAEVHLLDEPVVDVADNVLEGAIAGQVAGTAAAFFGDGPIGLPDLGFEIRATDAVAEPGGRYVRLVLAAP